MNCGEQKVSKIMPYMHQVFIQVAANFINTKQAAARQKKLLLVEGSPGSFFTLLY